MKDIQLPKLGNPISKAVSRPQHFLLVCLEGTQGISGGAHSDLVTSMLEIPSGRLDAVHYQNDRLGALHLSLLGHEG